MSQGVNERGKKKKEHGRFVTLPMNVRGQCQRPAYIHR
jgi:hypothetical protein